ncbi:hypothetical protein ASD65_09750 [Microbacterium sp. Root61]|uniref:acyl-CoA dehydrogenase family protein n=1 Tax=Microbacterium sp. Root61 TaxID=1736570 RepID=UPI0006F92DCC|nr:acyl-CoA dehydrogenase family protein [Microbacterium sp. Root61]KRA24663.1 hypothetical protein ASD65_09750 [Microbacterium sp. Root61]
MNTNLSAEAEELGAVVCEQLESVGGVDVLRRGVQDPTARIGIGDLLDPIGVWDLSPAGDQIEFEAAASVCRAAGSFAVPYPVVERLGRIGSAEATVLVATRGHRLAMHLDVPLRWSGVDVLGATYRVSSSTALLATPLAPFGVEVDAEPDGATRPQEAAVLVTLQAWWLLGLLERALADTVRYVGEREQFGKKLARFQGVGFTLAEMALATAALEELGKYTLWSVARGTEPALADALGLLVAAQTAADAVLRGAHQLHGAMGFTDEVDLSWLSRGSQGARRLPEGAHRMARILTETIGVAGLESFGGSAPHPMRHGDVIPDR